jgi:hypothetical protein
MALKRAVLERQLTRIQKELAACEQVLTAAGLAQDQWSRQPAWRHWDADRRQVARRLRAAAAIEQRAQPTESES